MEHSLGIVKMFQSPCGVLGVCRGRSRSLRQARRLDVSVPLRGFRGLQVGSVGAVVADGMRMFQSPCGVLGVCRDVFMRVFEVHSEAFQSPCGVLGVCRLISLRNPRKRLSRGVSVPLRGFRGLQGSRLCCPCTVGPRSFSPLAGF